MSSKVPFVISVVVLAFVACAAPEPSSQFPNGAAAEGTVPEGAFDRSELPTDFRECATQSSVPEARPAYLVFMFDRSGSMVIQDSPKWISAKAASKAFFDSPASRGVHASLSFFPNQEAYSCNPGDYTAPHVKMSALPSPTFAEDLDKQSPSGGTPTYVALSGAIDYAKQVAMDQGRDGRVAIVLVTDGLPDSECTGDSIPAVKELASSVAATLPTYVIGVGRQLGRLKEIAEGGGTRSAFIVSTDDPEQIQRDFLAAVNAIKRAALSCDYAIPPPPNGQLLDRNTVNVIHSADGAAARTIAYDQSCKNGLGWRYDDIRDPRRVLLCHESCGDVRAEAGQLKVLFGCRTQGDIVK